MQFDNLARDLTHLSQSGSEIARVLLERSLLPVSFSI